MSSIKERVRSRLLGDMIQSVRPENGKWKVLVVDKLALRIISAALRLYDIAEEGVTLVENIDVVRQPLPDLDAIYFITPCEESVAKLCNDFKKAQKPQYRKAHVFFTSHVPNSVMAKLESCEPLLDRLVRLEELNLEFLAIEQQVFSLDESNALEKLFGESASNATALCQTVAKELLTAFITLGGLPSVRYGKNCLVAPRVAQMLQDEIAAFEASGIELPPSDMKEPAVCLILDRSLDPLSPVIHEFTYQAMAHDLIGIEGDRYKYRSTNMGGDDVEKEVLLNDTDPLWPSLCHLHIADMIHYIIDHFNEFVSTNKTSRYAANKRVTDLKEMTQIVKQMPQYRELMSKYAVHIHLSDDCMGHYGKRKIEDWAGLEQNMAVGEDPDGHPVKHVDLINDITVLLQRTNPDGSIPKEERIRLIMTYLITQEGLHENDRKRMLDIAGLTLDDTQAIMNLNRLGVTLVKGQQSKKKQKEKRKKRKTQEEEVRYDLSRYQPAIKEITEELLEDRLSLIDFPYTREPSARAQGGGGAAASRSGKSARTTQAAPTWPRAGRSRADKAKVTTTGGRVIVVMLGGATYSESRSIYELKKAKNREVILGTTHMLTPRSYIEHLLNMKRPEKFDDA